MDKTEYIVEWHDGEVINKGELARCDKCKYGSPCILGIIQCKIDNRMHRSDWFCADGRKKDKRK